MNHEIEFKGQKLNNKDWVCGDLAKFMDGSPCIMPKSFFSTKDLGDEDSKGLPILSTGMALGEFFKVLPETVKQFTGKYTKSEQKVFEDDILQSDLGNLWIVKWSSLRDGWICFQWTWEEIAGEKVWSIDDSKYPSGHSLSGLLTYNYKVIGTIHDYQTDY